MALESRRRLRRQHDERRRATRRRRGALVLAVLVLPAVAVWALAFRNPATEQAPAPAAASAGVVAPARASTEITLPTELRGLRLSADAAGDRKRLARVLRGAGASDGLNVIVVDVKDERGRIAFPVDVPLARTAHAQRRRYDPAKVVQAAHRAGVYVIARVVAFQDPALARARRDLAVHRRGGGLYRDDDGALWLDPTSGAARGYVLDVARAAAAAGFDEVMFDQVRYPFEGATRAVYRDPAADRDRLIAAFLGEASATLRAEGVRVSAAVLGLAATRDLGVGQNPARLKVVVDALSPKIFPSYFGSGEYGIALPGANPHDTALAALIDWRARLVNGRADLRPWLQAFSRGSDRYGAGSITAQRDAAREAQVDGILLWTPTGDDQGVLTGG